MIRFLRYRVLFLFCMLLGLGFVFSGVTQAEIAVSVRDIDSDTGGNFNIMNYGECFFLLANPHRDECEEEVGPDSYLTDPNAYRSPSNLNGCFLKNGPVSDHLGLTNVCFGNATGSSYNELPVIFDTDGFRVNDFRVYRIDNAPDQAVISSVSPYVPEPDIAFAWSSIAGYNGGQYEYIPCPKDEELLDSDRFTTFDSEFVEDTAVTEIEINQTGSITLAYYFVNAANVCRALSYELFINGTQMDFGIISDFQSGKYLVFDVEGLDGPATIRLETILISDPDLPPIWCATATIPGVNAHISGVFISNCVPDPPQEVCSIGDLVWHDLNRNGIQDAGELGIPNVDVKLTGTDVDGNPVTMTDITDGSGNYLFMVLCEETYEVKVDLATVPAGFEVTTPCSSDQTIVNDSNSDDMTTCTPLQTVDLPDGNIDNTTIDFGFYQMELVGTGTPGYWKNHPEAWPVDEITIGGVTYTKDEAIEILVTKLKDNKKGSDKTMTMFQALVAAKLNVFNGTDPSCIADTIAAADGWMTTNGPVGSDVDASTDAWKEGEPLYFILDDYNNGYLCAPSRDDLE